MRRYVIMGTGAIGGTVGGRLAQHDIPVVWVARGEHGEVLVRDGMTLRTPDETIEVRATVWASPEQAELGPDDVLVLAVKTQQAAEALAAWADVPVRSGAETLGTAGDLLPILCLTNGLAAEDLALRYFERVYGVCVWCPATHVTPGEIVARYTPVSGVFHLGRYRGDGPDDLAREVARDWESARLSVPLPDDVMAWKRRKLVSNMVNAIDALFVRSEASKRLIKDAQAEARAVLAATGEAVVDDEEESANRLRAQIASVPGAPEEMGSSTYQSIARGTGSVETDYINGEIVRLGRVHGVPTPVNTALASLTRRAAAEGWQPRSRDAAALRIRPAG
ncbi:ketopantoate reductase family protein [Blastococcus sp. Marseille-P5729]|uniref:ketopantoate reductase family protein n=1 Tax=Blastococcus sp. Marseille-P5729 TaxID=2086582 RepID=UPI00131BA7A9|nr:2-dehydropantoate 2-reductase N-terminal domain-containing protein [Blastococcus sp. Marseille-P5729]